MVVSEAQSQNCSNNGRNSVLRCIKRKWKDEEDLIAVEALLDVHVGLPDRLPSFESVTSAREEYQGPTDESNWVIPGKLMVGAYPAEINDDAHDTTLTSILKCGITTFVCLQAEYRHCCDDRAAWFEGRKIRPYINDAYRLCKQLSTSNRGIVKPESLVMMHCPILDCQVVSDSTVSKLAESLCWRLVAGEVIYMHCWGGHGRTGTLVAVMLGLLYNISKAESLKRTQLYHDLRACPLQVPSPQTFSQRMQVLRILDQAKDTPGIMEQYHRDRSVLSRKRFMGEEFCLPIHDQLVEGLPRALRASKDVSPTSRSKGKVSKTSSDDDCPTGSTIRSLRPPGYASPTSRSTILRHKLGHLR